jgi:phosphinothricin acetyltransferase
MLVDMRLIDCSPEHGGAILAILNHAITTSTAVYDYRPRTPRMIADWFESKRQKDHPVIGALSDSGELIGFASYGPFRPWPAYKYTLEHSLYVAEANRGRGVGGRLLGELIERAAAQGYHALVGAIDSTNATSIRLHERYGFTCVGTLPQVGFKFGRWLDLCLYQRVFDTPADPVDG